MESNSRNTLYLKYFCYWEQLQAAHERLRIEAEGRVRNVVVALDYKEKYDQLSEKVAEVSLEMRGSLVAQSMTNTSTEFTCCFVRHQSFASPTNIICNLRRFCF